LAAAAAVAVAQWQWRWRQLGSNTAVEVAAQQRWQHSGGGSVAAAAWQHDGSGSSTAAEAEVAVLRGGSMAA
jgi:hypothetical protein